MSNPNSHSRARAEQIARREAYYKRLEQNKKSGKQYRRKPTQSDSIFTPISVAAKKTLAPIAINIYLFAILFFLSWLLSRTNSLIDVNSTSLTGTSVYEPFEVPEGGGLIHFNSSQAFKSSTTPLYSELELEIIDEDYGHVYSIYKDLWQERHPNGNGGYSNYHDWNLEYEIAFHKGGTYYIRPISYNKNMDNVVTKISHKPFGGLYLSIGMYVLGGISILLLAFNGVFGGYFEHIDILKSNLGLLFSKKTMIITALLISFFVLAWYAAVNHIGYGIFGDDTILPSFLYNKNDIIYLG